VNFFRYSPQVVANGSHTRLSPQANYYYGSFGAWAEYVLSSQEVSRGATSTTATTADNAAWQVGATYVLTGEKASYRSVTPAKELNFKNGTWGAFELGTRYAQLSIDKSLFPIFADPVASAAGAKSWTLGINWYANKNVKFVLNYEQTRFQSAAGAPKRKQEHAVLERFQLSF
jgi:phosphate-selective porin OprO/OprP